MERVTPTDIKDYRTCLQTIQKQKSSSINRRLAALRTFFNWSTLSNRVGRGPLNEIRPLRKQEAPPRWLDTQAKHKLQQALELHAPSVSSVTHLRSFERLLYRQAIAYQVECPQEVRMTRDEVRLTSLASCAG